jgi:hypothetical protein
LVRARHLLRVVCHGTGDAAGLHRWHHQDPDTPWMLQMARQLTDGVDGILLDKRYIILDRDTKYCQAFRNFLKREGIAVIRLPPRSPNLNAHAERWVRGIRDECLSRLIPIGQGMLRRALREYGAHFHRERNHQGPRQCADHAGHLLPAARSTGYSSCSTWRIAQLLRASGCIGLGRVLEHHAIRHFKGLARRNG